VNRWERLLRKMIPRRTLLEEEWKKEVNPRPWCFLRGGKDVVECVEEHAHLTLPISRGWAH